MAGPSLESFKLNSYPRLPRDVSRETSINEFIDHKLDSVPQSKYKGDFQHTLLINVLPSLGCNTDQAELGWLDGLRLKLNLQEQGYTVVAHGISRDGQ